MPMELAGDQRGKLSSRASPLFLLILAAAVLVTVNYVQHNLVPGGMEIAVRTCARLSGLLVVPVLVVLGFRNWTKTLRVKLPEWRNGLALSSMVLQSLIWMNYFVTSTVYAGPQIGNHLFHVDPLSWFATLLYSNLLAGLLAFGLTGRSRLLVLSSALFQWSSLQSGIYF